MLRIGLIGHSFCSKNFGLGALAFGEVYAIKKACQKANVKEVKITCFETAITDSYADDECVELEEYEIKNPRQTIRQFSKMDLVLDMSGGDSFSDIYGNKLYLLQMIIKTCVLLSKRPYILAPQTIGPFQSRWAKSYCNLYVSHAKGVFLRDVLSVGCLNKENQNKAVSVTDLGLMMPYEPREKKSVFTVGFNVSGLLYQKQSLASEKCDYKKLCDSLIEYFLSKDYNVLLIPHVVGIDRASIDNDYYICNDLAEKYKLPPVPQFKSPKEAKSFISQCDLFLGSRMHATIGAVSSGVPTVALAYSRKFRGVFDGIQYPYTIELADYDNGQIMQQLRTLVDSHYSEMREAIDNTERIIYIKENQYIDALAEILRGLRSQ